VRNLTSALTSPSGRRALRRRLALRLLRQVHSEITFRRNGFKWTGPARCSVTGSIFVHDHYQDEYIEPVTAWLRNNPVSSRSVAVNIGANLGDIALPLSRLMKRVIAIEPHPATFARLQHNVRQNGLDEHIECCEFAVSDEPGNAEFVLAGNPGNSELRGTANKIGFSGVDVVREVISVKTIRLDELLHSRGVATADVALVWSDTQGCESQVILSAPDLWKGGASLWTEIWPKGLDCHGGTDRFIKVCSENFRWILAADRLGQDPEPISALNRIVREVKPGMFTDGLLIP
jgi:FkbM family methyltransferase